MAVPQDPLVLLVDPDAEFTGWAASVLGLCGVASHITADLTEAEAAINRGRVGCVILGADSGTPMFRFGQMVARHPRRPLPVAYVTARAIDEAALLEAHYYSGVYLLQKPVSSSQLLAWVGSLLLLERQVQAQLKLIEMLEEQASTDPLTGLYNRRLLFRRMDEELARARRSGETVSLVYLDIDHFKTVNDTHGHNAGDEVLRQVAVIIEGTLRKSDIVGRIGGEEFVILLPGTAAEQALMIGERLRERIAQHVFAIAGGTLRATMSAGICSCTDTRGVTPTELIECADRALYAAKQGGRNRVVPAVARAGTC